jgi:hypothetical protein
MRVAAIAVVLLIAARTPATIEWSAPEHIPSPPLRSAWFPDLAIDSHGRVHVVYCVTDHVLMQQTAGQPHRQFEDIYYARRDASGWSTPIGIGVPQQEIYRNALAIDVHDRLHLLLDYRPQSSLDVYHRQASADDGFRTTGWQELARRINVHGNSYNNDLVAIGDVVHAVVDDRIGSEPCPTCKGIFYRRSQDGGGSWSEPVVLRPSTTAAQRVHLNADGAGALHATFDDGVPPEGGHGISQFGVYLLSRDGGTTWSEPTVVEYPDKHNAQMAAAGDARGGVMLVWRTSKDRAIYFQWSTDWGVTWTKPERVPTLAAEDWHNPYDRYELTADPTGRIHLLAGGVPTEGAQQIGIYELEWDGTRWSAPHPVYVGPGYAEYPHLVFDSSGGAHATWYVRAEPFGEKPPHQVWYARGRVMKAATAAPK